LDEQQDIDFTPAQLAALDAARRDLEAARDADLAEMDAAALIAMVERLRAALHSVIHAVEEP
jgi:hypothetical protein